MGRPESSEGRLQGAAAATRNGAVERDDDTVATAPTRPTDAASDVEERRAATGAATGASGAAPSFPAPLGVPRRPAPQPHQSQRQPESARPDLDTEAYCRRMWEGQSTILVVVRVRPIMGHDRSDVEIVKVLEHRVVVVLDPRERDAANVLRQHRSREKRYAFDYVFPPREPQQSVYERTTKFLIQGVLDGFNATVFAYGQTGAGKTYTMIGGPSEPGIMVLTMRDLFARCEQQAGARRQQVRVTVSFLEVYNENIRDLLGDDSAQSAPEWLDLREDPLKGPTVRARGAGNRMLFFFLSKEPACSRVGRGHRRSRVRVRGRGHVVIAARRRAAVAARDGGERGVVPVARGPPDPSRDARGRRRRDGRGPPREALARRPRGVGARGQHA